MGAAARKQSALVGHLRPRHSYDGNAPIRSSPKSRCQQGCLAWRLRPASHYSALYHGYRFGRGAVRLCRTHWKRRVVGAELSKANKDRALGCCRYATMCSGFTRRYVPWGLCSIHPTTMPQASKIVIPPQAESTSVKWTGASAEMRLRLSRDSAIPSTPLRST